MHRRCQGLGNGLAESSGGSQSDWAIRATRNPRLITACVIVGTDVLDASVPFVSLDS